MAFLHDFPLNGGWPGERVFRSTKDSAPGRPEVPQQFRRIWDAPQKRALLSLGADSSSRRNGMRALPPEGGTTNEGCGNGSRRRVLNLTEVFRHRPLEEPGDHPTVGLAREACLSPAAKVAPRPTRCALPIKAAPFERCNASSRYKLPERRRFRPVALVTMNPVPHVSDVAHVSRN